MSDLSSVPVAPNPQVAIVGVPESNQGAPFAYISPADCKNWLKSRWGLEVERTILPGHVLAASMACDQEGPWQGVKVDPTQERSWPRTFRYGWPNIIAAPTPILVAIQMPGAWPLNYEQVIPMEIVDWTCLEVYRYLTEPLLRQTTRETVAGASVQYAPGQSEPAWDPAMLDRMQWALLSPFQIRQARTTPFANLSPLG